MNAQGVFSKMTDTEEKFGREVVGYWTGFAETYTPNGEGRVEWIEGSGRRLVLSEDGSRVEQVAEEHRERCEFWIQVGEELRV